MAALANVLSTPETIERFAEEVAAMSRLREEPDLNSGFKSLQEISEYICETVIEIPEFLKHSAE